jgi:hypothetical protein
MFRVKYEYYGIKNVIFDIVTPSLPNRLSSYLAVANLLLIAWKLWKG